MDLVDFLNGKYYSRDNWGSSETLTVKMEDFIPYYYKHGNEVGPIGNHSTAHNYNDFYESDSYGNVKVGSMEHEKLKLHQVPTGECFKYTDGSLVYYKENNVGNEVSSYHAYKNGTLYTSSIHPAKGRMYYLCDRHGNKKINTKKEIIMKYQNVKVIVINSKTNAIKACDSENEALEYIEEMMEQNPRAKFTLFEPAAVVEPKVSKIRELLTRLTK